MARGLNQTNIIGNLGRDPEMRYTPSGAAVANFTVAVASGYGDKEETDWFRVIVWEKLAEACSEHLRKGSRVFATGQMRSRKYTNKEGVEVTTWELNARDVVFLNDRPPQNGVAPGERPAARQEQRPLGSAGPTRQELDDYNDQEYDDMQSSSRYAQANRRR